MKLLEIAEEEYLKHMETRNYPACFPNSSKFEEWQSMESIAHTKPRALPCRDCTNEYHSQMVSEGRCAMAGIQNIQRLFTKA